MQSGFWTWIGHLADLVALFGIPSLGIYYVQFSRKLMANRKIEAIPLGLNSGYKGLICSVSSPFPSPTNPANAEDDVQRLVAANEHPSEALLRTRIGPVLKAMQLHEKDLRHCWLIASDDSVPYLKTIQTAVAKYFPLVTTHDVTVPDVYCKIDHVYEAVHQIFKNCENETNGDLRPRDIITDVTSGTKIMSIAVAMACLDADRNLQYIEQKEQKNFYKIDITWEKIANHPK